MKRFARASFFILGVKVNILNGDISVQKDIPQTVSVDGKVLFCLIGSSFSELPSAINGGIGYDRTDNWVKVNTNNIYINFPGYNTFTTYYVRYVIFYIPN